jgi:hypothetical protein
MAEFCKQCAEEMGFEPDFVGLTTEEDTKAGLVSGVLCEGCGFTYVNHLGECVYEHCDLKHGVKDATQL